MSPKVIRAASSGNTAAVPIVGAVRVRGRQRTFASDGDIGLVDGLACIEIETN
jgi:hypothetical protein